MRRERASPLGISKRVCPSLTNHHQKYKDPKKHVRRSTRMSFEAMAARPCPGIIASSRDDTSIVPPCSVNQVKKADVVSDPLISVESTKPSRQDLQTVVYFISFLSPKNGRAIIREITEKKEVGLYSWDWTERLRYAKFWLGERLWASLVPGSLYGRLRVHNSFHWHMMMLSLSESIMRSSTTALHPSSP